MAAPKRGDTRYNPYPSSVRVPLCPASWTPDDIQRAAATPHGDAQRTARAAIRAALGVDSPVVLTSNGTAALAVGLRALRQRGDDQVILPTFACPGVVEAVLAAGMRPVLCDVGEDGVIGPPDVSPHLGRRTRAVIAPHVLGATADLLGLERLCADARVALVDDAAQSLGGSLAGRPLGTFGSFGVLSFGRQKPVYAGGGGALVVLDPRYAAAVAKQTSRLGHAAPATRRLMALTQGGAACGGATTRHFFDDVAPAIEAYRPPRSATMDSCTAALVTQRIGHMTRLRDRARGHLALYDEALEGIRGAGRLAPARPGATTLCTLRVPPSQRHEIATVLAHHGVETTWLYYPLHRVGRYAAFASGDYPGAEALWRVVLSVPCRGEHDRRSIGLVSRVLRSFLHGERRAA